MKKLSLSFAILLSISLSGQVKSAPDSLDLMIGQMIMVGIGDFSKANAPEPIFNQIKEGKVGGVVLYQKNLAEKNTAKELKKLVARMQKNAPVPLFIGIDEEGGKVRRLKDKYGFPFNPSAEYLGSLEGVDSTRFYAFQTANLLDSLGINMNYAPVLDVNTNPTNPVIGGIERSYSADYQEVIINAREVIDAHSENNVIPVVKHFPGHGSSLNDTHMGITDVTRTWQFEELYPYKSLIDSGYQGAIMTAHIINQSLDRDTLPSTLSKRVITGLLRGFMGYEGVIISDDMQMGAIKNEYGLRESIKRSINAGVDILMFANNVKDYDLVSASQVSEIIKDLIDSNEISYARIEESYARIMLLKNAFGLTAKE